MSHRRAWLILLALGQLACASAANAASPAAWICRAEVDAGGGRLSGERKLDAKGRFVAEGANWSETVGKQQNSTTTLSVAWPEESGRRLKFDRGLVRFFVTATGPVAQPYEFRMAGARVDTHGAFAADYAPGRQDEVEANFPLGKWKSIAGRDQLFLWSFLTRDKPLIGGVHSTAGLLDVEAKLPLLGQALDAEAKEFGKRCTAAD